MDIKLVQTAQLREISKLRLQTASLMQALLEARQQLQAAEMTVAERYEQVAELRADVLTLLDRAQAAEQRALDLKLELEPLKQQFEDWARQNREYHQRAAEAEAMLRKVLVVEWDNDDWCPWCANTKENGHMAFCPRQAAAAWLEAGEETAEGKE